MPEIVTIPNSSVKVDGNIKILSTEVQEIISQKPSWIVQNGIVIFMGIILFLISLTFFIHYPDVVITKAIFSTTNSPKEVKAHVEGKLVKLLVAEGTIVKQDDVIGYLESRAIHEDVISLSEEINKFENASNTNEIFVAHHNNKNLGEVQPYYQIFLQAYNTYKQYLPSGFYAKKKMMLFEDIVYLNKLHNNIQEQKKMQQEDVTLASKNFEANKSLNNDKVIADVEFRNEKSKFISKALSIPQLNAQLINNDNSSHEKQKEIAQLENDIVQQKEIFIQALHTFKAQIDDWKNKYLLIAPIAGKVSFTEFLQEKSQLRIGQTVCFINPENTEYFATLFIPQTNFGKIKIGETVLLKLNAYPFREFGIIKAKLNFISTIPTDSGFAAKVVLPNGLITDYKKQLKYSESLTAQAEIIIDDQQLSDRLFNSIKVIFLSNSKK